MLESVEATDPLIVFVTIFLTWLAGKIPAKWRLFPPESRDYLPFAAVAISVGLRAAWEAMQGEAVTFDSLFRAFLIATTAAWSYAASKPARRQLGMVDKKEKSSGA